jgi:hypothetical protein
MYDLLFGENRDLFSAENEPNGVPGAFRRAVKQHIDPGSVTEAEPVPGGGFLDSFQIGSAHHEIDVSRQSRLRRVGFFDVNQNCQSADQFMRDVLSRKRIRDLV